MHWLVIEAKRQAALTAHEPGRFLRLAKELVSQPGRVNRYLSFVRINRQVGKGWSEDSALGTRNRAYQSYEDYLEHQSSKLQHIDLSDYDVWFRDALGARLAEVPEVRRGMSVLCLAARVGTEVKAFQDAGCFAVGIDLNPGPRNRFVLPGDFHDIQFPSGSIDLVYTNSLDHAFNVKKLFAEIRRVLKPSGAFMLEAPFGARAGQDPGAYESFWWSSDEDLEKLVWSSGFRTIRKRPVHRPFEGVNFLFGVGPDHE